MSNPFIDDIEGVNDELTTDPITGYDVAPEQTDDTDFITGVSSGMQLQNPLSRLAARGFVSDREYFEAEGYDETKREFIREKGYSPLEDPQIKNYDPELFTSSMSANETAFRVKKVKENQKLIKEASLVGEIAGAIGNPLYLATAYATRGASLGVTVGAEVWVEVVNEAVLHSQQPLRTKAESIGSIAAVGVLTTAFGAAAKVIDVRKANRALADAKLEPIDKGDTAAIRKHGSLSAAIQAPPPIDPKAPVGVKNPKMVKGMGGTLTSPVTDVLVNSESNVAKQIIKDLADPAIETTGVATTSVESAIKQADGDIANMRFGFVKEYKTYRKNGGNLNEEGFNVEVARAMRQGDIHSNAQVAAVAKHYRKFDQSYYDQALKFKMYPEDMVELKQRGHLQRIYNRDSLVRNGIALKRLIMKGLNDALDEGEALIVRIDPKDIKEEGSFGVIKPEHWPDLQVQYGDEIRLVDAEMSDVADSIIDNLKGKPGTVEYADIKHAVPKAGSLHERTLNFLSDEQLEPYLENNASAIMAITAQQMTRSIQMTKKFGNARMSDQLKQVREDYTDMLNKTADPNARVKLQNRMEKDLLVIKAQRDLMLGTYGAPENVGKMVNISRTLRAATLLSNGLNITTSSLNDLAAPALRHGFKPFIKGLGILSNGRKATAAYKTYVQHLGLAVNSVTNSRAIAFADSTFAGQKEKDALRAFSKYTGLNFFVDMTQGMNAISTSSMWLDYFKKWDSVSPNAKAKLHQMGIDNKMAVRIQAQVEKFGKKTDGVMIPESQTWTDEAASAAFENALRREVHSTTLIPGKGDSPLWTKGETGKFFFMFQSFITSAHSKFLISGMQRADADFLTGILAMTAMGAMTVALKDSVRGKDPSDKEVEKWIYEGLDRGGMLGLLAPPVGQGMAYMTGKVPSRYAAKRDLAGFFLNPAPAGFALDVVGSATGAATGNENDMWRMLRLMPMLNTFHAVDLLQTATDNRPKGK